MPVFGLVLTHPRPEELLCTLRLLPGYAGAARCTPGRLPLAFTTEQRGDEEGLLDRLRSLPGVLAVDIAYVDFSDLHTSDPRMGAAT